MDDYVNWSWEPSEVQRALYSDVVDFVNFRIETATSCIDLIRAGRVADALGLCRVLLENYLLLRLMARGWKYFQLVNMQSLSPEDFQQALAQAQQRFEDEGEPKGCLEVRKYARAPRHLMYVFEGLGAKDADSGPVDLVPYHFFQFQEFTPEALRLRPQDYFQYYEPPDSLREAFKRQRSEADAAYRHYLSYDALLACLRLNDLLDEAAELRVEAHYTFLGRFIHPTHGAARDLQEHSNWFSGGTGVGTGSPYTSAARLLAATYVCHLLSGTLEEVCGLLDRAPARYVADARTGALHAAIAEAMTSTPYLWFLFNDPAPYDKYIWAIHYATDDELDQWGGYEGVPNDRVQFTSGIFGQFSKGLQSWSNQRCGEYSPPIAGLGPAGD